MYQFTPNETPGGVAGLPGHRVPDDDIVITDLPEPEPVTSWQRVFRLSICPRISMQGMLGLRKALQENDSQLITGATSSPPPLQAVAG
jgi:hypothetical protein